MPSPRAHLPTYHGVLAPASDGRERIVPAAARDTQAQVRTAMDPPRATAPERMRWAEWIKRVFALDLFQCERCGGRRRLIALIRDPFVARANLGHLGLQSESPPTAPPRAPPQGAPAF